VLVTGEPDEAARLVRTQRPHLVLLDLMPPGRDGVVFMRETSELAELAVIFILGYEREETIVGVRSKPARPTTSPSRFSPRNSPRGSERRFEAAKGLSPSCWENCPSTTSSER